MQKNMIWMIIALIVGAFAAPTIGAVSHFGMNEQMNDNTVVTAPHPGYKVVRGRNVRRWWNGLDDDEKSHHIEAHYEKQRSKQKNKHRRNACAAIVALLALVGIFTDLNTATIATIGLVGMTTVVAEKNHRWTPKHNQPKDGQPWSSEQGDIINYCADMLESGDIASLRLMISACAGSGKTTVLKGILRMVANAVDENPQYMVSIGMIAFNKTIANMLKTVIEEVKPDGADWEARTLNSHGDSTLRAWIADHGNSATMRARYRSICFNVMMNALGENPAMYQEWRDHMPQFRDGNPKWKSGWFQIGNLLKNTVEKAMGYGLGIEGSNFDWDSFIRAQRFALKIHEMDYPSNGLIMRALPSLAMQSIQTAMRLLEDPSEELEIHPKAPVWNDAKRDPRDEEAWKASSNKRNFRPQYPTLWNKGLRRAEQIADVMLDDAGVKYSPKKATKQNISAAVADDDCGFQIKRYRVGNDDRIQIITGFGNSKKLNGILYSMGTGHGEYGSKVRADGNYYVTANGYANNPKIEKKMPREVRGQRQWISTIRDHPEAVAALCDRVLQYIKVDITHLFMEGADEASITNEEGYVVGYDFIDQIYAPAYFDMPAWRTFDLVLADEVQDLSVLQGMMLQKLTNGGAVLVGDEKQSIYGFSGASPESMAENRERFGCELMPMNTCFRQTHALARDVAYLMGRNADGTRSIYADHVSPDWIPSWPEGTPTEVMNPSQAIDEIQAGDMVECRLSAPLAEMAIEIVCKGIPVVLAGGGSMEKNIRREYLSIYPKDKSRLEIREALNSKLETVLANLLSKYKNDEAMAKSDESYGNLEDVVTCINSLMDLQYSQDSDLDFCLPKYKDKNTNKMVQPHDYLAELFAIDEEQTATDEFAHCVILTTVHRAKGLENGTVFIIADKVGTDEEGNEKIVGCFMLPWSCNTEAEKVQERNLVYVCITRAESRQIIVSHNADEESDIRDGLWMMDTLPLDDESDDADEGEDPEDEPITEMDIIEDEFEDDVVEVIMEDIENASIEAPESPETVEDVVEATPDENEAVEMPLFACIWADSDSGEIKGADLTNDLLKAKSFLEGMMCETTGYKPGMWVKGHSYDCAVFKTDLEMPDDVVEAINASITSSHPLANAVASFAAMIPDDDEPDVDGGETVSFDAETNIEVVDIGDELVEIDHTPVVDDETPTRTRKTMDDRIADLESAVDALTNNNTGSTEITDVAEHMGCSVDTVKRVLDEMRDRADGVLHPQANVFNDERGSVTPLMDADWTEIRWVPEHQFDAQDRIVIKCQRSPTGRFARSSKITFRHIEYSVIDEIEDSVIDDETPETEHKTPSHIDDDPEGKYKDNARYKCPHPDCMNDGEDTAVRVENGEDFCEHRLCTWVESDCLDDEDENDLTLYDLDKDQLISIIEGLEDRDEYIKGCLDNFADCLSCNPFEGLEPVDEDDDSDDDTGITEDSNDDDGGDTPSVAESTLEHIVTGKELVSEDPNNPDEKKYKCNVCKYETKMGGWCPYSRVDGCNGILVEVVDDDHPDVGGLHDEDNPIVTQANATLAVKVAEKLGIDGMALSVDENPSFITGCGMVNADETVMFTVGNYSPESEDKVVLCTKLVRRYYTKETGSLQQIFKTPAIVTINEDTHCVEVECGKSDSTSRMRDLESVEQPPIMPDFTPTGTYEISYRQFKELVTVALKGGKNAGDLHGCGVLWIGRTQVPEKAVKALADALKKCSKKAPKWIEIRDNSGSEHTQCPLVIRGMAEDLVNVEWEYIISPMDEIVADKPTLIDYDIARDYGFTGGDY